MTKRVVIAANFLRFVLGWFMVADGISILQTPGWSASGFLTGAKTFPAFYAWFALPMNAWWVDPLNSWGITLIGVALVVGVGSRYAAWAGAALMILYYFPHYTLPLVPHGYLVEEHIIYAAAFILIALMPAANTIGLARYLPDSKLFRLLK
jgi:thiosulfate dehydrogenase [quinone] large subunit